MVCWNCGRELRDDAVFCDGCGESVNVQSVPYVPDVPDPVPDNQEKKLLMLRIGIACIAALVVVLGVTGIVMSVYDGNFYQGDSATGGAVSENNDVFLYPMPEGVSWGMKEGDVKEKLGGKFNDYSSNGIVIITQDADIDYSSLPRELPYRASNCDIAFGFNSKNQLEYVSYWMSNYSSEPEPYSDGMKIKNYITKFYGEPTDEKINWMNDRYKNDKVNWDKAYREEHCESTYSWEIDGYLMGLKINKRCEISYSK